MAIAARTLTAIKRSPRQWAAKATIRVLESTVKEIAQAYFNSSKPIVSDAVYDELVDSLKKRSPQSKALTVGAPAPKGGPRKVRLPAYLGSLNKAKDAKALAKFTGAYDGPYHVTDKLDGISFLYGNINGKHRLFTRGDGRVGQDISQFIEQIASLPKLRKGTMVRGELIMKQSKFNSSWSDGAANPRNLVAGMMNRKSAHGGLKDIDAIAYELIEPSGRKPSAQIARLKVLGFRVPKSKTYKTLDAEVLAKYLGSRKKFSFYELDGLVIRPDKPYRPNKSGNPDNAIAFKVNVIEDSKLATVKSVVWRATRYGKLKPVLNIKPTKMKGVTVERATAHNAKYIKDNKLGPGAVIRIIRSGDTIPYIQEVIEPASRAQLPPKPSTWEWDGVDIVTVSDTDSQEILLRAAENFFVVMGVEGFRYRTIKKVLNAIGDSDDLILDILDAAADEELAGYLGGVTGDRIQDAVYGLLTAKHKLDTLMKASGKFQGLGTELLAKAVTVDGLMRGLRQASIRQRLTSLQGFGDRNAEIFASAFPGFKTWLKKSGLSWVLPTRRIRRRGTLTGEVVLFTGFRDKNMVKEIEAKGGSVANNWSRRVSILVMKEGTSSEKVDKAKAAGVPVVTSDVFSRKYLR